MDTSRAQSIIRRWPIVTIALVATAITAWFIPPLREVLIYDRQLILHGQFWRIVTGEFVHFSASHLVCDVAVIAAAGAALETRGHLQYFLSCLLVPIAIGVGLVIFEPEMRFYGGLSGLATAFVVMVGIEWLKDAGRRRWLGILVLATVAFKLVREHGASDAMFVNLAADVAPSHTAHVLGAIAGALATQFFRPLRPLFRLHNLDMP